MHAEASNHRYHDSLARLLVASVTRNDGTQDDASVRQLATKADLSWEGVIREVIDGAVACLFYRNLGRLEVSAPEGVTAILEALVCNQVARSIVLSLALEDVAHRLEHARVPYLSLKGPCLSKVLYGDCTMRRFGDLDILAPDMYLEALCDVLNTAGYSQTVLFRGDARGSPTRLELPPGVNGWRRQTHNHLYPFVRLVVETDRTFRGAWDTYLDAIGRHLRGRIDDRRRQFLARIWKTIVTDRWITVEPHFCIQFPGAPGTLAEEEILSRSVEVELTGRHHVRSPEIVDLLACQFEHFYKEARFYISIMGGGDLELRRLIELLDLCAAVRRLNRWNEFLDLTERNALQEPVLFGLGHLDDIFDLEWTSSARERLTSFETNRDSFLSGKYGCDAVEWRCGPRDRFLMRDRKAVATELAREMAGVRRTYRCRELSTQAIGEAGVEPLTLKGPGGRPWTGKSRFEACWRATWDQDRLSLFLEVVDDAVVPLAGTPRFLYDQDAVKILFFDPISNSSREVILLLCPSSRSRVIGIEQRLTEEELSVQVIAGITGRVEIAEPGYRVRVDLRWGALGMSVKAGDVLMWDIEVFECRDREQGVRRTLSWAGRHGEPVIRGRLSLTAGSDSGVHQTGCTIPGSTSAMSESNHARHQDRPRHS